MEYQLKIGGKDFSVRVGEIHSGAVQVSVNGTAYAVSIENRVSRAPQPVAAGPDARVPAPAPAAISRPIASAADTGAVTAPIPGLIVAILVSVGDSVHAGQIVATMEAMKMENNLTTHVAGTVKEIRVQKGGEVSTGDVIMQIG